MQVDDLDEDEEDDDYDLTLSEQFPEQLMRSIAATLEGSQGG